jgi:hypothetical protein
LDTPVPALENITLPVFPVLQHHGSANLHQLNVTSSEGHDHRCRARRLGERCESCKHGRDYVEVVFTTSKWLRVKPAGDTVLAKLVLFGVANLPPIRAAPLRFLPATLLEADGGMPVDNATLWVYLGVAVALVLLGGAFAGLTIALMGQVQSNLALLT